MQTALSVPTPLERRLPLSEARSNGSFRAETILGLPVSDRPWSCVITVTPAMAQALIETMPLQRPVRRSRVARYSQRMKAGAWRLTHQGIGFDTSGRVIDGQHRLLACIDSGCDLTVMATFCLSDTVYEVVDQPEVRTLADALQTKGLASGNIARTVQGAARIIQSIDAGLGPLTLHSKSQRILDLDVPAVEQVLRDHPRLIHTAEWVRGFQMSPPKAPAAPLTAMATLFREVDETLGTAFVEQIMSGEGLQKGDPALVIRNSINDGSRPANLRLAFLYRLVRGWRAVREGRKLEKAYGTDIRGTGFPPISGYKPKHPAV